MATRIAPERTAAYLRTLAETGNATLAAERAGVSRDWAYKRRKADARFDRLCREAAALARARLPVRVNRDRAGGWSAALEARFIERLSETGSVWLAAAEVGLSTVSAYRRRQVRRLGGSFHPSQPNELGGSFHPSQPNESFAAKWDEAQRLGWPPADEPWIEAAMCFLEGQPPPPGNPVRFRSVDQVINAMRGTRCFVRPPRK